MLPGPLHGGRAVRCPGRISGGTRALPDLRQDLIHNSWTNLMGVTAEYALMMPGGSEAAMFGHESAYAIRHGTMHRGLSDIVREPRHIE